MDAHTTDLIHACSRGADEERLAFTQILAMMQEARYLADLCRNTTTYYLPNGESLQIPLVFCSTAPAVVFSATGVAAAVKASQTKQIAYHGYCDRIAVAGCVSYLVSITGRRVVSYGRTGESHTEHFPPAMP